MLTIARLTILEASRRKLLLALAGLTVVVIVLTSWGFSRLPTMKDVTPAEVRLAASQLTILVAFMFSGVLALGSTLVAAPAIASDIESGIALAILPRPIRRSEVLMGKWLGLAVLIAIYAAGSGLLEMLGIWLATGYVPPNPAATIVFVAAEGIVLMSLALLLSTRLAPMTGG
ncbi:MAG TPA: ABC transporter permease subunit, partial [Candidatus Dormibacteraeota bacterium]